MVDYFETKKEKENPLMPTSAVRCKWHIVKSILYSIAAVRDVLFLFGKTSRIAAAAHLRQFAKVPLLGPFHR